MYPQLQDVKNYLGISSTDDDFLLGLQLTQATKIFEELCGRVFAVTTDTSRTFYADDRGIVNRRKPSDAGDSPPNRSPPRVERRVTPHLRSSKQKSPALLQR